MVENSLPVLMSRLDFGLITTLHILYPPLTIGLAAMMFIGEALWLRTADDYWYRLCRFFEKLLIINFAAGVATGITMELAFGILYGPFSEAAGPFFGQILGYETITAFMYEAGFIGLMIFGWGKISRKMHLFATFNVALSVGEPVRTVDPGRELLDADSDRRHAQSRGVCRQGLVAVDPQPRCHLRLSAHAGRLV